MCAKGAGSSLLRDAEGLERMATTVRAASRSMRRTPLTIKIRMGYEDDPASWVAHDVVSKAKGWGAAAVTLHGRTRQQRYSRRADWAYVRKCASAAAKTGLLGLSNVIAIEGAKSGIQSNVIAPAANTRLAATAGGGEEESAAEVEAVEASAESSEDDQPAVEADTSVEDDSVEDSSVEDGEAAENSDDEGGAR